MSATATPSAISVASEAPMTPRGWWVPHPAMSTGARTRFTSTVKTCTIMVGRTIPVPRRAAAIETRANCAPSAGMKKSR